MPLILTPSLVEPRPIIFIASPFAVQPGDPSSYANEQFARVLCRIVAQAGGAPFAPHLLCPSFLRDDLPEERNLGISIGLAFMAKSIEAFFVIPRWRTALSSGMRHEYEAAKVLVPYTEIVQDSEAEPFEAAIRRRPWAKP